MIEFASAAASLQAL